MQKDSAATVLDGPAAVEPVGASTGALTDHNRDVPARPTPSVLRRLGRDREGLVALGVIVLFVLVAIFASYVASDPTKIEMVRRDGARTLTPPYAPSADHLLGTDRLGRDLWARIVFGLRTSLVVGIVVRGFTMLAGIALGVIAGYAPRAVDAVLSSAVDTMLAFPPILLAMTVTAILGPGLTTVCIALVLVSWPDVTRLVRSQVFVVNRELYVEAAKASGASGLHIALRHILPNCLGPIVVAFSMGIPGAIMYEAGLSFFGYGIQPPTPSLGSIISDGRGYIRTAPYFPLFPGLVLTLIVLAFNRFGDALLDALNPRRGLDRRMITDSR